MARGCNVNCRTNNHKTQVQGLKSNCHWSWERDDGERNTLAYYTRKDH